MSNTKTKKIFIEGPITPEFIAKSIASHQSKHNIGAHQIFLGQIRADEIEGNKVQAIEFSAYTEMAEEVYSEMREEIFAKYELSCMHVYHSLGIVHAGEINLFVFVSSPHRKESSDACGELVEMIKGKLPVWGKILYEDESHTWKVNQ